MTSTHNNNLDYNNITSYKKIYIYYKSCIISHCSNYNLSRRYFFKHLLKLSTEPSSFSSTGSLFSINDSTLASVVVRVGLGLG